MSSHTLESDREVLYLTLNTKPLAETYMRTAAPVRPVILTEHLTLGALERLLVETLLLSPPETVRDASSVWLVRMDPREGTRRLRPNTTVASGYVACVEARDALVLPEQLALIRRDINPLRLDALRETARVFFLRARAVTIDDVVRDELLALVSQISQLSLPWSIVLPPGTELGAELQPWARTFRPCTPSHREIRIHIKSQAARAGLGFDPEQLDVIAATMRGLRFHEIESVLAESIQDATGNTDAFLQVLREHRGKALREQVGVEVLAVEEESFGKIGGMELLKHYVRGDAEVLKNADDARAAGLRMPKGFVLVGLPGCGKSLAARLSAGVMGLPLLRLDLGGLMGKYLGESEKNLESVLDSAQAQAPCVLWVDEMDKAFGSLVSDGSSATGQRMLGKLLTWMQDNDQGVYLIATANDISKLPPELVRRGRFDELFFVDLPEPDQRLEILELKLRDARLDKKLDDATKRRLAHDTCDGYTGADIDALVSRTQRLFWLQQHDAPKPIDLVALFNDVAKGLVPLSYQFKSRIDAMRQLFSEQGFLDVNDDPTRHGLRNFRSRQDLPRVLERLLEHEHGAKLFDAVSGAVVAIVTPELDYEGSTELILQQSGRNPVRLHIHGRELANETKDVLLRIINQGSIELLRADTCTELRVEFIERVDYTKLIAIDLGTAYSSVAIFEESTPTILCDTEGNQRIPNRPGLRWLGIPFMHVTATNARRFYNLNEGKDGNVEVRIDGFAYNPQHLVERELVRLKNIAEKYLRMTVRRAVVVVPNGFDSLQRAAVIEAGHKAGLKYVRPVSATSALALARDFDSVREKFVVICDIGAGTLNVSVCEFDESMVRVISTDGDLHFGGDDIDILIVEWIVDEFKKKTGAEPELSVSTIEWLKKAAEKAKIELSTELESNVYVTFLSRGDVEHFCTTLTRTKFDVILARFIHRIIEPIRRALDEAGVSAQHIAEVLLAGGTTQIPLVQDSVRDLFAECGSVHSPARDSSGMRYTSSLAEEELCLERVYSFAEECTAGMGAAHYAGMLAEDANGGRLRDVTPHTLGIELHDGTMIPVIPRNTTIPTQKTERFTTTKHYQTAMLINILQGERRHAHDNKLLESIGLEQIAPKMRGVAKFDVTIHIDSNHRVCISIHDLISGHERYVCIGSSPTAAFSSRQSDKLPSLVRQGD